MMEQKKSAVPNKKQDRVRTVMEPDFRYWGTLMLTVGWLIASAGGAQAVDGTILITQARALTGNVTPGDAAGFPVTISQPGSYRLASNLTVPNENTTAIEIRANSVTLDLNGFTIEGPVKCEDPGGGVIVCDKNGSGFGVVTGTNVFHTVVVNGTVRGMGFLGMQLNGESQVRHVQVIGNAHGGLRGAANSNVSENVVSSNGGDGINILAGLGSLVTANVVFFNTGRGITIATGGVITGNTVTGNTGIGLDLDTTTGYSNNVVNFNGGGNVSGGIQIGGNVCGNALCP